MPVELTDRMRNVLRLVEWSMTSYGGDAICPVCRAYESDRAHELECELALLIGCVEEPCRSCGGSGTWALSTTPLVEMSCTTCHRKRAMLYEPSSTPSPKSYAENCSPRSTTMTETGAMYEARLAGENAAAAPTTEEPAPESVVTPAPVAESPAVSAAEPTPEPAAPVDVPPEAAPTA